MGIYKQNVLRQNGPLAITEITGHPSSLSLVQSKVQEVLGLVLHILKICLSRKGKKYGHHMKDREFQNQHIFSTFLDQMPKM